MADRTHNAVEILGVWVSKQTAHSGGRLDVHVELADGTYRTIFTQEAIEDHDGPISFYSHARAFHGKPRYEPPEVYE